MQVSTGAGKGHAESDRGTISLGKDVMEGLGRDEDEVTCLCLNRFVPSLDDPIDFASPAPPTTRSIAATPSLSAFLTSLNMSIPYFIFSIISILLYFSLDY